MIACRLRWLPLALGLLVACEVSNAGRSLGPASPPSDEPAVRWDLPSPPAVPSQTLAFTRYRWAVLRGEQLEVFRTGDFAPVARFEAPGARNLVPVLGAGLLTVGPRNVQRLSARASRPETFPELSGFSFPGVLFPHPRYSEQVRGYVEGEASFSSFDLGKAMPDRVPSATREPLEGFDRRAIVGLRDGGFAHTVPEGIALVSASGRRRVLALDELSHRVWALAPSARLDRLWALDDEAAHLVALRGRPRVTERVDLPPGGVAVHAAGSRLALLSVERRSAESMRMRVDVWDRDPRQHRVLRFSAATVLGEDFQPEVALATHRPLVATRAFATQVFDFRRGVRLLSTPGDSGTDALAANAD